MVWGGGRDRVLYNLLKYVLLGPWLRLIFRPVVEGRENVPEHGPAIIASNHLSFSDSIFMPLMVKRKVTFVQAEGTYMSGMPGGGAPPVPQPNSMLLGAIITFVGAAVLLKRIEQ